MRGSRRSRRTVRPLHGALRLRSWLIAPCVAACVVAALGRAQDPSIDDRRPPEPQSTPAVEPAKEAPARPAYEARYHSLDEIRAFAEALAQSGDARLLALPATARGTRAVALEIGAPGPIPLESRRTIFLLGGLDGVSLTGAEAVVHLCSELAAARATLPDDLVFVAVPWASPDALGEVLARRFADGRDATPRDDDGDLAVDEDGPDDVDGDGLVLQMIVEEPNGAFVRCADPRFLAPARPGERPRFTLASEGRDDDGDGRFNEDPRGGTSFEEAFPPPDGSAGPALPLEDPLARALADLVLARRALVVLLVQGNHGAVARAAGATEIALQSADAVSELFARATGRVPAKTLQRHANHALEWLGARGGALALEVSPWGPLAEAASAPRGSNAIDARFDGAPKPADASGPAPVASDDLAWARWLDNTRGGIGFVDWHPVNVGEGKRALVGGWLPFSRDNAPPESLSASFGGLANFALELARGAPSLAVRSLEAKRDGEVVTLRARVEVEGSLASGPGSPGEALVLELDVQSGTRVLWGETRATFEELGPRAHSREVACTLVAPAGTAFTWRARSRWCGDAAVEVRP